MEEKKSRIELEKEFTIAKMACFRLGNENNELELNELQQFGIGDQLFIKYIPLRPNAKFIVVALEDSGAEYDIETRYLSDNLIKDLTSILIDVAFQNADKL